MNEDKRTTEIDITAQTKKKASKYVMTASEKKELAHTVTSNAVMLFLLGYIDRAEGTYAGNGLSFSDDTMADLMGWSKRTAQRARLELEKAGYVLMHRGKLRGGLDITITLIGKYAVMSHIERVKNNIPIDIVGCNHSGAIEAEIIDTDVSLPELEAPVFDPVEIPAQLLSEKLEPDVFGSEEQETNLEEY